MSSSSLPFPSTQQRRPNQAESERQPLLSNQNLEDQSLISENLGTGFKGMANAVKRANDGQEKSAWVVQASAFAFVALMWSLVLTKMPWRSLPLFGYHPLLQSLSLILLVQSLLTLQPTTAQDPTRKKAALNLHQLINMILLLPLLTIGASIMYYLHNQPGAEHWISWHGILGGVVLAWAWIQALFGAMSVWFKGSLLGGENKAKSLWKWHRLSGYLLLVLFLVVYVLGATQTTWTQLNASKSHHIAVIVAIVLLGVSLLARVNVSKLPRR